VLASVVQGDAVNRNITYFISFKPERKSSCHLPW